ncbi:hypothetical protein EYF80_004062 [Liparis tanakae]|uniref:Uncharacterized protein n=1 Tax=Liparis tanakae TaxID=230148 RepID=A0A4Z2J605_9TELE|nr:hypothetical protein EYF80_004062 [Liparis tanakae]
MATSMSSVASLAWADCCSRGTERGAESVKSSVRSTSASSWLPMLWGDEEFRFSRRHSTLNCGSRDAGGKDLVLPTAPRLGDDLDDLLQGTAHPVGKLHHLVAKLAKYLYEFLEGADSLQMVEGDQDLRGVKSQDQDFSDGGEEQAGSLHHAGPITEHCDGSIRLGRQGRPHISQLGYGITYKTGEEGLTHLILELLVLCGDGLPDGDEASHGHAHCLAHPVYGRLGLTFMLPSAALQPCSNANELYPPSSVRPKASTAPLCHGWI